MLSIYQYLAFFSSSFLLSLLLTPLIRRLAIKKGQVALPKEDRWHKKETALMGGVGIFASFIMIWALAVNITGWTAFGLPYLPMVLCASAIFFLGLTDDLFNMVPQHKLAGQIVIASILIVFGFRLDWTTSKTINLFLSIIWLIGITNAFNLLDNMDGLAAGIALVSSFFLALITLLSGNGYAYGQVLTIAVLAGSLLGFLLYNFQPASIFMGDCGSLFIGFLVAGCSRKACSNSRT